MIEHYAVKMVAPDVAKNIRGIHQETQKLEPPYYQVEEREGSGKATCRDCGEPIKEGAPTIYFHYAPDGDNEWIRDRGSIHRDECNSDTNDFVKCPKCPKGSNHVDRSEWSKHWTDHKKERLKAARYVVENLNKRASWDSLPDEYPHDVLDWLAHPFTKGMSKTAANAVKEDRERRDALLATMPQDKVPSYYGPGRMRLPGNYKVAEINTLGDANYEGNMMSHCLGNAEVHHMFRQHNNMSAEDWGGNFQLPPPPPADVIRHYMPNVSDEAIEHISSRGGSRFVSLRDQNGLPKATWWEPANSVPGTEIRELAGFANHPLKPKYEFRVRQYLRHNLEQNGMDEGKLEHIGTAKENPQSEEDLQYKPIQHLRPEELPDPSEEYTGQEIGQKDAAATVVPIDPTDVPVPGSIPKSLRDRFNELGPKDKEIDLKVPKLKKKPPLPGEDGIPFLHDAASVQPEVDDDEDETQDESPGWKGRVDPFAGEALQKAEWKQVNDAAAKLFKNVHGAKENCDDCGGPIVKKNGKLRCQWCSRSYGRAPVSQPQVTSPKSSPAYPNWPEKKAWKRVESQYNPLNIHHQPGSHAIFSEHPIPTGVTDWMDQHNMRLGIGSDTTKDPSIFGMNDCHYKPGTREVIMWHHPDAKSGWINGALAHEVGHAIATDALHAQGHPDPAEGHVEEDAWEHGRNWAKQVGLPLDKDSDLLEHMATSILHEGEKGYEEKPLPEIDEPKKDDYCGACGNTGDCPRCGGNLYLEDGSVCDGCGGRNECFYCGRNRDKLFAHRECNGRGCANCDDMGGAPLEDQQAVEHELQTKGEARGADGRMYRDASKKIAANINDYIPAEGAPVCGTCEHGPHRGLCRKPVYRYDNIPGNRQVRDCGCDGEVRPPALTMPKDGPRNPHILDRHITPTGYSTQAAWKRVEASDDDYIDQLREQIERGKPIKGIAPGTSAPFHADPRRSDEFREPISCEECGDSFASEDELRIHRDIAGSWGSHVAASPFAKELKKVKDHAQSLGWAVDDTASGWQFKAPPHLIVPGTKGLVTTHAGPSDHRAFHKFLRDMKNQGGFIWPPDKMRHRDEKQKKLVVEDPPFQHDPAQCLEAQGISTGDMPAQDVTDLHELAHEGDERVAV